MQSFYYFKDLYGCISSNVSSYEDLLHCKTSEIHELAHEIFIILDP